MLTGRVCSWQTDLRGCDKYKTIFLLYNEEGGTRSLEVRVNTGTSSPIGDLFGLVLLKSSWPLCRQVFRPTLKERLFDASAVTRAAHSRKVDCYLGF